MNLSAMLLFGLLSTTTLAQVTPTYPPPAAVTQPALAPEVPLNNGPCMDSPRAVPLALQPPAVTAMQIVRIDKVVSTSTMLENDVIGFLYTLQNGSTWLGQRSQEYMSGADAAAINQVLASTHLPAESANEFPPLMKHGIATKYQQFFQVNVPPAALTALNISIEPCVAWPAGRDLPTPSM